MSSTSSTRTRTSIMNPEAGDTHVRTVLVTAPDRDTAERLTRSVVEEGLAACGNVVPEIISVYRWQGEVRRDLEALVILKTTDAQAEGLTRRVVELHPYEVPEVLVMRVSSGHAPYLQWVRFETGGEP
jgi:periplasmic divalent cation tolerance protein